MEEITLITAFFDIGRKDYELYPRTNQQYFDYFKAWARIRNKLVVYTSKENVEEIKKIRAEFGLLDKTIIIQIDDVYNIEPELLKKMENISNSEDFKNIRFVKNAVENNYQYDYIMLLKYYFVYDAVKKGRAKGMVAWIDFGFNHGNDCYIKPEEFDFLWKTKLAKDKVHLFSLEKIDNRPIFRQVMLFNVNIMGPIIVLPDYLCEEFWNLVKQAMESLIDVGFIDDDQVLLDMAYRKNKKIFEIHISDWFLPLKENGGEHLTVKVKEKPKISVKNRIRIKISKKKQMLKYWGQIKEILK